MKPSWNRFVLEWNRYRFDFVVCETCIVRKAFPLFFVKRNMPLSRIIVGPLGSPVMDGGHVPIVTCGNQIAFCLGSTRLCFAPLSRAFKRRADIGHFLHPRPNRSKVGIGFNPTGRR